MCASILNLGAIFCAGQHGSPVFVKSADRDVELLREINCACKAKLIGPNLAVKSLGSPVTNPKHQLLFSGASRLGHLPMLLG